MQQILSFDSFKDFWPKREEQKNTQTFHGRDR